MLIIGYATEVEISWGLSSRHRGVEVTEDDLLGLRIIGVLPRDDFGAIGTVIRYTLIVDGAVVL